MVLGLFRKNVLKLFPCFLNEYNTIEYNDIHRQCQQTFPALFFHFLNRYSHNIIKLYIYSFFLTLSMWLHSLSAKRETTLVKSVFSSPFCVSVIVMVKVFNATFNQLYFSYIVAVSVIGGGNRSTRRKPPTCCISLTNFIT